MMVTDINLHDRGWNLNRNCCDCCSTCCCSRAGSNSLQRHGSFSSRSALCDRLTELAVGSLSSEVAKDG